MSPDVLTPAQRRYCMSRIRGKDTKPELAVRQLLHGLGYRYRLHDRRLPGRPDLVFPGLRKVIFVHGCFWHRHNCRFGRVMPSTRRGFWSDKFLANKERDARNRRALRELAWSVFVVWECQIARREWLAERLVRFLDED